MENFNKGQLEYLRKQARDRFEPCRKDWIDVGKWVLPHRARRLMGGDREGQRNNNHIVDVTHILALRSYVAGFLEGNTSASRPWFRINHPDPDVNRFPANREWLDKFTRSVLRQLSSKNFYHAAGQNYYDVGTWNTGAYYIDEMKDGLFWYVLTPGSYYVLNNNYGIASIMVREFPMTVKALVDAYGEKDEFGSWKWSNFSGRVRKLYEDGNYSQLIDVVHVCKPNEAFNPNEAIGLSNREWVSYTYEVGSISGGQYYQEGAEAGVMSGSYSGDDVYLKVSYYKRKPFIVTRSDYATNNFEYGEKGPSIDALGCIKSLNKKAIGKDIALDQMLNPATQGPANLRKSYISTVPRSYVPLDPQALKDGGLRPVFQINPAIATLNADVSDLRNQVDKLYYADYLLYLTRNPKTRTATETNAVIQEQQLIIGPNLQSLNWTHNVPVVELVMDWVVDNDPYLPPPPEGLAGQFLKLEFISVFAQAQKAADLPAVDRYIEMVERVGQLNPKIWDKANIDKLADIYEDRLFLPAGLNNEQSKVDAMREQAFRRQQRQEMLNETVPALAGAASDLGLSKK